MNDLDGASSANSQDPEYQCGPKTPLRFNSDGDIFCGELNNKTMSHNKYLSAEVPPGFFYNAKAQTKVVCPVNQYQVIYGKY